MTVGLAPPTRHPPEGVEIRSARPTQARTSQELWVEVVDHAATSFWFSMSIPFLKVAPGADEGDEMWSVDGTRAILRRDDERVGHRESRGT